MAKKVSEAILQAFGVSSRVNQRPDYLEYIGVALGGFGNSHGTPSQPLPTAITEAAQAIAASNDNIAEAIRELAAAIRDSK